MDTPHLVRVDASTLPHSLDDVASLGPRRTVTVSHGCEERRTAASRKRRATLGGYCAALAKDGAAAGYLKQQPLNPLLVDAGRAPWSLEGDFVSGWRHETAYLWVGPKGATTGLHSDDEDNVLLVLSGAKRVLLYPPGARRHLLPNDLYVRRAADESRRRRGWDVDMPWETSRNDARDVDIPWDASRGGAAAGTWIFRGRRVATTLRLGRGHSKGDESQRCPDVDIPRETSRGGG